MSQMSYEDDSGREEKGCHLLLRYWH